MVTAEAESEGEEGNQDSDSTFHYSCFLFSVLWMYLIYDIVLFYV